MSNYYSGVANDYAGLRAALFSACEDNGWSVVSTDILSKGGLALQVTINTASTVSKGAGLVFQGGTEISGGALINPSPIAPRMGPLGQSSGLPTWPMEYFIHIYTDPDEVFIVTNHSVDVWWWASFGQSKIPVPGTGLWIAAVARAGQGSPGAGAGLIQISPTSGGIQLNNSVSCGAPFWGTAQTGNINASSDTMHVNLDGISWANGASASGQVLAVQAAVPHIQRSPSVWNDEAILLPIRAYLGLAEGKRAPVIDMANARYTRVDNYAPGQVITLGDDQWRVYPFYRKNAAVRDGGSGVDHTGTLGWAIRYAGD